MRPPVANHRLAAGVVNCCKLSAALGSCCSHVVRCVDDTIVEQ